VFDAFAADQKGWEDYFAGTGERPSATQEIPSGDLAGQVDSVAIASEGLARAQEDPEVKNVVLDISNNSGGSLDVLVYLASVVSGRDFEQCQNTLTKQLFREYFDVDRNLDGTFDEKDDLKAIVNYFKQQPYVDASRIVLIGESQGGLVTALAAAEMKKDVSEIVLVYPALCIPDNWNERYPKEELIPDTTLMWKVPLGRRYFKEVRPLKVFKQIGKFKRPVLIVQGDKDQVVSMKDSERAVKTYKNARLHVIPGARHGFKPHELKQSVEQITLFLNQNNPK
jgi:dienelactone hydrolase